MVCTLIDFAHFILELLIAKVCGFIDISKIEFFKSFVNRKVKQSKKFEKPLKTS